MMAVLVSLASEYPLTFPPSEKHPWLKWLNQRANAVLKELLTSYSVCDFMDHYALDYFRVVQFKEEGYTLVIFPQPATWHGTHSVDSLLLDPLAATEESAFMCHFCDGTSTPSTKAFLWPDMMKKDGSSTFSWLHPCILNHRKWLPHECPICFDDYVADEMVALECSHFVCPDCFTMYAATQVNDISQFRRENPFRCPQLDCRRGIRIWATVKPYLTEKDTGRVREWIKDLNHPVSKQLPNCRDCGAEEVMRKKEIDGFCVYCDKCKVKRCEYCVCRIRDENIEHLSNKCKGAETLKFARRYYRASPETKEKCEDKFPWIKIYAQARVESLIAIRDGPT